MSSPTRCDTRLTAGIPHHGLAMLDLLVADACSVMAQELDLKSDSIDHKVAGSEELPFLAASKR